MSLPSSGHPYASSAQYSCARTGCDRPALLQCPTCLKNAAATDAKFSHFCCRECFKTAWPTHRLLHGSSMSSTDEYNPWPAFNYTGKLRPWPYGPKKTVPAEIGRPDYADSGVPLDELNARKFNQSVIQVTSPKQLGSIRRTCQLAREVLDTALSAVKPGVTTDELDTIVHENCIKHKAYPSPLNYHHFPRSCCTSVNEVICHGIPDTRPLLETDIVNIDVTLFKEGVHGDLNGTVAVDASFLDANGKLLIKTARECLDAAIAIVRPGVAYRDLGSVIEKHASQHGFSIVRSYCGHGIGTLFHCAPSVPHYARNKAHGIMKVGHVFTIEPMVNEGTWQDISWPDEWTATTVDGKRSAQFEETIVVTESGCDVLTRKI